MLREPTIRLVRLLGMKALLTAPPCPPLQPPPLRSPPPPHPPTTLTPPAPAPAPQASTLGIAERVYHPGVKLGDVRDPAASAGLRRGDIVLSVGDLLVAPSPSSVTDVVRKIK